VIYIRAVYFADILLFYIEMEATVMDKAWLCAHCSFHDLKSQGKVMEFDYRRPVGTLKRPGFVLAYISILSIIWFNLAKL